MNKNYLITIVVAVLIGLIAVLGFTAFMLYSGEPGATSPDTGSGSPVIFLMIVANIFLALCAAVLVIVRRYYR